MLGICGGDFEGARVVFLGAKVDSDALVVGLAIIQVGRLNETFVIRELE